MEDIELYDFDHIYDNDEISSNINRVRVILYGVVGETDFNNFHEKLLSYATAGNIEYIVRHAPFLTIMMKKAPITPRTYLKGFGIARCNSGRGLQVKMNCCKR